MIAPASLLASPAHASRHASTGLPLLLGSSLGNVFLDFYLYNAHGSSCDAFAAGVGSGHRQDSASRAPTRTVRTGKPGEGAELAA
jgi:hypothetical protein